MGDLKKKNALLLWEWRYWLALIHSSWAQTHTLVSKPASQEKLLLIACWKVREFCLLTSQAFGRVPRKRENLKLCAIIAQEKPNPPFFPFSPPLPLSSFQKVPLAANT